MHAPRPPGTLQPWISLALPALGIAALALATLLVVWVLQWAGYAPCELCLKERIPFYWGVPLAVLVAVVAWQGKISLLPAGYAALGLVFLADAALGAYHAGVEWKFWPGPSSCTGDFDHPATVNDFLHQLQTAQVVRCDAPALHVLGLSLAAWNVVLCLGIVAIAVAGFLRSDRARA